MTPTITARQWKRSASSVRSNSPALRAIARPRLSAAAQVIGWCEPRRVSVDPGEPRAKRLESILDAFGDVGGVGPWELLDDHDQSGSAVDDGIPDERLVIDLDLCDVTERDCRRLPLEPWQPRQDRSASPTSASPGGAAASQ